MNKTKEWEESKIIKNEEILREKEQRNQEKINLLIQCEENVQDFQKEKALQEVNNILISLDPKNR